MECETVDQFKSNLQDVIKVQCSTGNWNYDPYMHGMANGLICAMAILTGEDPEYLNAPESWLKDKKPDGKPEAVSEKVLPNNIEYNEMEEDIANFKTLGVKNYEGCMQWVYGDEWRDMEQNKMSKIFFMKFGDPPRGVSRGKIITEKWKATGGK